MQIELPDGTRKDLDEGATGADLAAAIGPGLARAALAVKSDGHLLDLARPLEDGSKVEIVTDRSPDALELIRHDTAHVLAAAVLDLYPGTRISIGPAIEDGFYYDFEFPDGVTVSEHDLPALEEKMREHVKAQEPFVREDVTVDEALERFRAEGQDYKVELIEDLVKNEGVDTVATCAAARTRPRPAGSRRSSCSRSPARTGAGTRRGRCSPASTAPRSSPRPTSTRTSSGSSRPARATTASSAAS